MCRRVSMYVCIHVSMYAYTSHTPYTIHHTSYTMHQTSHIHHISYIIYHTSYIIHHTSYIIHHTSYIMHHASYIIHHTSYIKDTSYINRYKQPVLTHGATGLRRLYRKVVPSRLMPFSSLTLALAALLSPNPHP